jgi:hypothetical protein
MTVDYTGIIELTDLIGSMKISITVDYCIEVTSYDDARPIGSEPMSSERVTNFEILDCYLLNEDDNEPYKLTESEIEHFKNKLIDHVF